jgi:ADP-heptose:LPS heptosyltransferase
LVGLHTGGAKGWNRRWPMTSYAELGVRLVDHISAALVLVGSDDEREETVLLREKILAHRPDAGVYLSIGDSLNRAANLIDHMDLLVGNDSAPAHVAAALSTPTVVIYGPTGTEGLWARIYPEHRGVNRHSPCQNLRHEPDEQIGQCEHACPCFYVAPEGPYPKCLTDITVDDVWQVVRSQVDRRGWMLDVG